MSIRSIERITGVHRDTILRLLVLAGQRCQQLMERKITNLRVQDVKADEIWGFVGKKEGRKSIEDGMELGDAYCYVAMERSTKLVLTYHLGKRSGASTERFLGKLRYAVSSDRFQFTTDGFHLYTKATPKMLGRNVDFAQLIKVYGTPREKDQRYSPGESCGGDTSTRIRKS